MNVLSKWFFAVLPRTAPKVAYVAALVQPNEQGGWSIRTEDDPAPLGNYATAKDAERIARINFEHVYVAAETPNSAAV